MTIQKGYYPGITVQDWINVVQSLNGACSKLCYGCKRTWAAIQTGNVHIKENVQHGRKDCDMQHVFYCDGCVPDGIALATPDIKSVEIKTI